MEEEVPHRKGDQGGRGSDIDLQSFTKYMGLALITHYGKILISFFQELFASIDKMFVLAGGLGTGQSFYGVQTLS